MSLRREPFLTSQSRRKTALRRHDERLGENHVANRVRRVVSLTARSRRTSRLTPISPPPTVKLRASFLFHLREVIAVARQRSGRTACG
jgi:hypothetical protein